MPTPFKDCDMPRNIISSEIRDPRIRLHNLIVYDSSTRLTAAWRSTHKRKCPWHQVARTVVEYWKLLYCLFISQKGTKTLWSQWANSFITLFCTHNLSTIGQSFEFYYLHCNCRWGSRNNKQMEYESIIRKDYENTVARAITRNRQVGVRP